MFRINATSVSAFVVNLHTGWNVTVKGGKRESVSTYFLAVYLYGGVTTIACA
jgi:hypothetical protein